MFSGADGADAEDGFGEIDRDKVEGAGDREVGDFLFQLAEARVGDGVVAVNEEVRKAGGEGGHGFADGLAAQADGGKDDDADHEGGDNGAGRAGGSARPSAGEHGGAETQERAKG